MRFWNHNYVFIVLSSLLCSICVLTTPAAGYSHTSSTQRSEGQLNILEMNSQYLEGEFYSRKAGIYFRSASDAKSSYLTITTHAGKNMISTELIDKETSLVSLMDNAYIFTSIPQQGTDRGKSSHITGAQYSVSKSNKDLVIKALRSDLPLKYLIQYNYLDGHNVNVQKQIAEDLQNLLVSEEGNLIRQAVLELGRRGVQGADSSGCMALYVLAMRLADLQAQTERGYGECKTISTNTKRAKSSKPFYDLCGRAMKDGSCPVEGVCGVGCECWKMVCGDCCYHTGCHGFRGCGCKMGQVSFGCFNLFSFKCDSMYNC